MKVECENLDEMLGILEGRGNGMIPDQGHGKVVLHQNENGSMQLRDILSRLWCACGGAAVDYFRDELPQYRFKCIKCSYEHRKESKANE